MRTDSHAEADLVGTRRPLRGRWTGLMGLMALLFGLQACGPRLLVRSLEPSRYAVGAARELVVIQAEGRRSAVETVLVALRRQARTGGYFRVVDLTRKGGEVMIAGRAVRVRGYRLSRLGNQRLGMRIDVIEWRAEERTRTVTRKDKQGRPYDESVRMLEGHVVLAVTAFGADGDTLLAETEYEGVDGTEDLKNTSDDRVLKAAADDAVAQLLNDLTPIAVTVKVPLDDSDPRQKPIIETALAGNVAQATTDIRRFIAKYKQSASAHYNYAVFLDAMGKYKRALREYDRAIELGGEHYYSKSRSECARREAATRALE